MKVKPTIRRAADRPQLPVNPYGFPWSASMAKTQQDQIVGLQMLDRMRNDAGEFKLAVYVSLAPEEWLLIQRQATKEQKDIHTVVSSFLKGDYQNSSVLDVLK